MNQETIVKTQTKLCDASESPDPVKAQRNEILDRIFALLKERGVSQKEFAEMLQVRPQTITDWRKGKSNSFMKKLGRIAAALNTTAIWLFSGDEIKSTEG